MSLSKLFQRIIWHNNTTPAINEDNLNAMSKAIDDIDDRVILIGDDVVTVIPQIQAYLEQAESIVEAVEELSQNPPYIGANGNWYVFDTTLEAYKDSGVDASITVDIADITMIAEGAQPNVTNTGTSTDPIFHLFLPRSPQGATGNGIANIAKTGTQGLVDTYTITMTDGTTYTFTVTNGQNGSGTGDMLQSDYDSDSTVKNAGGIADYVEGEVLNEAKTRGILGAKNILPDNYKTQTLGNTVEITALGRGAFKVNGTANATGNYQVLPSWNYPTNAFKKYVGKEVILSADNSDIVPVGIFLVDSNNSALVHLNTWGNEKKTVLDGVVKYSVYIQLTSGTTYDNVIVKPMVRLATDVDDTYQPYSMTNQEMTPYVEAISNPNLLDNPWFTVNQRGQSSYTGNSSANVYTVDRWYINRYASDVTMTVNNDGTITLTNTGSNDNQQAGQFLEDMLLVSGKTYTLSLDVVSYNGTVRALFAGHNSPYPTIINKLINSIGVISKSGTYDGTSNKYKVVISLGANSSITLKAVKLELGSVSTLAQDTAPNYQQELAKCQRYFYRHKGAYEYVGYFNTTTNFRANLALPVPMRAIPSMTLETPTDYAQCAIYDAQGNVVNPSAIAVDTVNSIVGQPEILLNSTVPTHTQNMCGVQRFNLRIDLSADL